MNNALEGLLLLGIILVLAQVVYSSNNLQRGDRAARWIVANKPKLIDDALIEVNGNRPNPNYILARQQDLVTKMRHSRRGVTIISSTIRIPISHGHEWRFVAWEVSTSGNTDTTNVDMKYVLSLLVAEYFAVSDLLIGNIELIPDNGFVPQMLNV